MPVHIGHFQQFKGDETVLFGIDGDSLARLCQAIESLAGPNASPIKIHELPFVVAAGIKVVAESGEVDIGISKMGGGAFIWKRSCEGWREVLEKLQELGRVSPAHQYLEGPKDQCQVMASVGEYPASLWQASG